MAATGSGAGVGQLTHERWIAIAIAETGREKSSGGTCGMVVTATDASRVLLHGHLMLDLHLVLHLHLGLHLQVVLHG